MREFLTWFLPYLMFGLLTVIHAVKHENLYDTADGIKALFMWPLYWVAYLYGWYQFTFNAKEFLRPVMEPGVAYQYEGVVKWFNPEKGYGFITMKVDAKEQDVFVHYTGIKREATEYAYLHAGDKVSFFLSQSTHGPVATGVSKLAG